MDSLDLLRRLGSQADGEADPQIDVRGRVLRSLHRPPSPSLQRNLTWVSLAACSLAMVAGGIIFFSAPDGDNVASLSQVVMRSAGPEALLKLVEP